MDLNYNKLESLLDTSLGKLINNTLRHYLEPHQLS